MSGFTSGSPRKAQHLQDLLGLTSTIDLEKEVAGLKQRLEEESNGKQKKVRQRVSKCRFRVQGRPIVLQDMHRRVRRCSEGGPPRPATSMDAENGA